MKEIQYGADYEALDNGISWCEDIQAARAHLRPFRRAEDRSLFLQMAAPGTASLHAQERRAGYRYDLSLLQAKFSLKPSAETDTGTDNFFLEFG